MRESERAAWMLSRSRRLALVLCQSPLFHVITGIEKLASASPGKAREAFSCVLLCALQGKKREKTLDGREKKRQAAETRGR